MVIQNMLEDMDPRLSEGTIAASKHIMLYGLL